MVTNIQQPKKKSKNWLWGLGIFVIGLVVIITALATCGGGEDYSAIDLNASIRFDGSQFHIVNQDSFNWTDVRLKINDTYAYNIGVMPPGEYTIGCMQFSKDDGTRFNPFGMKVNNISIYCDVNERQNGFWYGKFN